MRMFYVDRNMPKVSVNFTCQRCSQPLSLDSGFTALDEHTMAELSLAVFPPSRQELSADPTLDRLVAPIQLTDSSTGSGSGNCNSGFMLVGETGTNEMLSHNLKVTVDLLDMLSDTSSVDHPLCQECCDQLLDLLDQELHYAEEEVDDYKRLINKLRGEDTSQDSLTALEAEYQRLHEEEKQLLLEVEELQKEDETLQSTLKELSDTKSSLEQKQEDLYKQYNQQKRSLIQMEDDYKSADNQLKYVAKEIDKLSKTNVFNATFHIWHSGHFGTINGFRLGRLPTVPVEWNEINAAWGQTVLLLTSLANNIGLTFQKYRLVPFGNHSYIEALNEKKELPLYGSGGFRFFWDRNFDLAMVAFLDCMQQFKANVESGDSEFCLPYRINADRGRIEDESGNSFSIKIQFNSEEQWTKALKYMLTDLKWGLAWVATQFAKKGD